MRCAAVEKIIDDEVEWGKGPKGGGYYNDCLRVERSIYVIVVWHKCWSRYVDRIQGFRQVAIYTNKALLVSGKQSHA